MTARAAAAVVAGLLAVGYGLVAYSQARAERFLDDTGDRHV